MRGDRRQREAYESGRPVQAWMAIKGESGPYPRRWAEGWVQAGAGLPSWAPRNMGDAAAFALTGARYSEADFLALYSFHRFSLGRKVGWALRTPDGERLLVVTRYLDLLRKILADADADADSEPEA